MEVKRVLICSVLYCVRQLCSVISTFTRVNEHSYSSLDWVLSHWVHFTVRRFACVCLYVFDDRIVVLAYCEHGGVGVTELKPNP